MTTSYADPATDFDGDAIPDLGDAELPEEPERIAAPVSEPEPGPGPDKPPAHMGRDRQRARSAAADEPPPRLTGAKLRRDITAKVGIVTLAVGKPWQMRDALCGGTFMESKSEIDKAFVDLILDSPDLVDFFTGPAGGYMKWLNLAVALQPVVSAIFAHHVAKSITGDVRAPADLSGLRA